MKMWWKDSNEVISTDYCKSTKKKKLIVLWKLFVSAASGMKYLRQQDIIHRDIKPGNIMRKVDENGRWVSL